MATPALGTGSPCSFTDEEAGLKGEAEPPSAGRELDAARPVGSRAHCVGGVCQPWATAPWAPCICLSTSPLHLPLILPFPDCQPY